jgi:hypothetical protein
MNKIIICTLLLIILTLEVNATSPCLISFQASGFRLTNGTLISSSNVTLYVYNSTIDTIPQYNETFATGLQKGYISVTMGNTSSKPLNLNWGVTYWLALDINGTPVQMVDYGGIQTYRKAFISTQGEITALSTLNSSIFSLSNLSYSEISNNIGNYSSEKLNIYTNITTLQTSNTTIWTWLNNLYSNVTILQISNNSIWTWINNLYSNVTILQTSNVSTNNRINILNNTLISLTDNVTSMNNLSYSQISDNLGNFSSENSTIVRAGTKSCPTGQVLMNATGNSSGIYGDCVVTSSTGIQYNTSIGIYFNKTTTTYTGSLTSGSLVGYMAGHAICNTTYPGTHFCSQEEIIETIWHTNVSTMTTWSGTAWINSGAPKYAPATTPVNDCNGWTSAVASSYLGNYWAFSTTGGGVGSTINCGTSISLACCEVG